MRYASNLMTPRRISKIKRLLATNTIRKVAALSKESYTTIYRVSIGAYDTGKLKNKQEKVKRNFFNVEQEQDWILGGRISKRDTAA